ncbi:hypothetical protein QO209_16690 [Pseudomonas citronellolis]|uniref:hypothetical protein n=1 Tax=Pseudomonas citronellolis TaxID=53408 RepID=UPI00264A1266|nr:hypothetical protein [Pseudomonas citronellolis]MDN6874081.1 hypothetical protein [Pseudomonas citronellolis]
MKWLRSLLTKQRPSKPDQSEQAAEQASIDSTHDARMRRIRHRHEMSETYGVRTMLMQISALKPDTRPSHAARHGKLFTQEEVDIWYAENDNSIGCRCTFVEVMIDEDGNPEVPAIVERARQTFEKMKAKGKGEWTKLL